MNSHTRVYKKTILFSKHFFFFLLFIVFVFGIIYLNFYFKIRNVNYTFFDEKSENVDIQNFTSDLLQKQANNFLSFLFVDENDVYEKLHREFPIVSKVKISKNFSMNMNVVVSKNEEFFYTCVGEDSGFLVKCMIGNTDGEYYSGMDYDSTSTIATSSKISIEINPKVLFDMDTDKKIEEPDSLSGARIYTKEDFRVLREILKWVQKNGFEVQKVYVDELKIVDISTDHYKIRASLDKGYVDTIKDFETISKTGDLQKYINDDKGKINYIDLSYKNKVFFKLKSDTKTDIMSTTTASTTATSTAN